MAPSVAPFHRNTPGYSSLVILAFAYQESLTISERVSLQTFDLRIPLPPPFRRASAAFVGISIKRNDNGKAFLEHPRSASTHTGMSGLDMNAEQQTATDDLGADRVMVRTVQGGDTVRPKRGLLPSLVCRGGRVVSG